jgi:hypothetical protein
MTQPRFCCVLPPSKVLSDQIGRGWLRPAAAPVFGQQLSLFRESTMGDATARQPEHPHFGPTAKIAVPSIWSDNIV